MTTVENRSLPLEPRTSPVNTPKAIGVFGHYGNKNLGDEAIIEAVLQNIAARLPGTRRVCLSIHPEDSAQRYQVTAYPIRRQGPRPQAKVNATPIVDKGAASAPQSAAPAGLRQRLRRMPVLGPLVGLAAWSKRSLENTLQEIAFLRQCYTRLKTLDVLMVSGSNQFLDNFGGSMGFPYTLLKWTVLARMAGVKVFFVSVGAGPLERRLSHRMVRRALHLSQYVSLRDATSAQILRDIGVRMPMHVYPDLAHSLRFSHVRPAALPAGVSGKGRAVVGINPMPLYDPRYWHEKDERKYSAYLGKMVRFVDRLIAGGHPFFLFGTQEKDYNVIEDMLRDLSALRSTPMPVHEYVLKSQSVDELMANIQAADLTVATRFHGTLLSLHAGKPMLGVYYHRKSRELMQVYGQGDYAVDLDTFDVDDLWERFERLLERLEQEKLVIDARNVEYAALVSEQYDRLLGVQGSLPHQETP